MAAMISEVYDAFRAANVPEKKAREAAEAVANQDNRLNVIEAKLTMMQWMLSGVGFGVLILVIKSFVPA